MAQAATRAADPNYLRTADGAGSPRVAVGPVQQPGLPRERHSMRQLEADWVCTLNSLPAGLLLLDEAGVVSFANDSAIDFFGTSLVGRLWRDLIADLFDPRPDDGHDISVRGGRKVSVSTRPLPSGRGQLLLFTDVTETRQLQAKIATRERLSDVGQMAAGLVHQIRTPLGAATLYASQLATQTLPDELSREYAGKILNRLRELDTLVRELLVFARGGGLKRESTGVDALLEDLVASLSSQLEAAGISLHIDSSEVERSILGNREALVSALQNPIVNALQAGARAIAIQLECRDRDSLVIRIVDDGPGIPAEQVAHVFEPFYTTRCTGTGLGLAMVKLVAEAHGGRAWAELPPGGGTSICLRLPLEYRPSGESTGGRQVSPEGWVQ